MAATRLYKVACVIRFEGERHCLQCPIREESDDSCRLQGEKEFGTWEAQMEECPLVYDHMEAY